MKMNIENSEVVSKKDFKKTDLENVYTHKEDREVAIVRKDLAVVIGEEDPYANTPGTKNNKSLANS